MVTKNRLGNNIKKRRLEMRVEFAQSNHWHLLLSFVKPKFNPFTSYIKWTLQCIHPPTMRHPSKVKRPAKRNSTFSQYLVDVCLAYRLPFIIITIASHHYHQTCWVPRKWARWVLVLGPTLHQIGVFSVGWCQELHSKKITGEAQSLVQRSLLGSWQQHQYALSLVLEAPAFMLRGLHLFLKHPSLRAISNDGWHCLICLWPFSLVDHSIIPNTCLH